MSDSEDCKKQVSKLTGSERFWSVIASFLLFVGAGYLQTHQLNKTTTEKASDGTWKSVESPVDTQNLTTSASILAALLLLYAINGLRVVRFSAGKVSLDTLSDEEANRTVSQVKSIDPSAELPIEPKLPPPETTASPEIVQTEKGKFERYQLSEVPPPVIQAALADWPEDNLPPKDWTDFMFALRKTGRGNHPWIIKFRDRMPVVVSYGGQGKEKPTVTKG
jgi:hypothetical protein